MIKQLFYSGKEDVKIFFWVLENKSYIKLNFKGNIPNIELHGHEELVVDTDYYDYLVNKTNPITANEKYTFEKSGIYCIVLKKTASEYSVEIESSEGVYPFVIPGPGIMHGDFSDRSAYFDDCNSDYYFCVPKTLQKSVVSYVGIKNGVNFNEAEIFDADNNKRDSKWLPEMCPLRFRTAEHDVGNSNGWWKVHINDISMKYRIIQWQGLPVFFEKPPIEFPYVYIKPINNQNIDYRFTVSRYGAIESTNDILYNEEACIPVVPGNVEVNITAGFDYKGERRIFDICEDKTVEFTLDKCLDIPNGWLRGDNHMHSVFEDAATMPDMITKAGRCNGLDYMVLTDHGGKKISDNGALAHYEENRFLPIMGQECVTRNSHMNFLNVNIDIPNIGTDNTEADFIKYAKEHIPGDDYAIILNHPAHLPSASNVWWGRYFRSWWVASEFKEVELVGNFDLKTWYDYLCRGRKLTGVWDTDTHDGTVELPGNFCSYVYTNGELNEKAVIKALKEGRVSCACKPGAFINMTVNGKMLGEHTSYDNKPLDVHIDCQSNIKMDKIVLIGDGLELMSHSCGDELKTEIDFKVNYKVKWLLAVMYSDKSSYELPSSLFVSENVGAFTNPIWID